MVNWNSRVVHWLVIETCTGITNKTYRLKTKESRSWPIGVLNFKKESLEWAAKEHCTVNCCCVPNAKHGRASWPKVLRCSKARRKPLHRRTCINPVLPTTNEHERLYITQAVIFIWPVLDNFIVVFEWKGLKWEEGTVRNCPVRWYGNASNRATAVAIVAIEGLTIVEDKCATCEQYSTGTPVSIEISKSTRSSSFEQLPPILDILQTIFKPSCWPCCWCSILFRFQI